MAKKFYLLDTNILLYNPKAIFGFESGSTVGVAALVLEQLDHFKKEGTDRGINARRIIRYLDELRSRGSLGTGVKLDNGSIVQVVFLSDTPSLPFKMDIEDNEILLTAMSLKNKGYDVEFISKDLNARVKADALGLKTQDYTKEYVTESEVYKGWRRLQVPAIQLKKDLPLELDALKETGTLETNEFILVESQHNEHNYRIFRYTGKNFIPVVEPKFRWPLHARNAQQLMALNLLLDDSIQMVSLLGPAGTGKTFLALLAGLHKVLVEDVYRKMLVARPVVPLGKDVGYLPGTLQEKLFTWMLPIHDNMELIAHSALVGQHMLALQESHEHAEAYSAEASNARQERAHGKKQRTYDKWKKKEHTKEGFHSLEELIKRGKVSLEAITYMRGRSIPYQYILIDEVQNLTPHEVKTIVSRVGEGSKLILAGDPQQIDAPYLDFSSNGLVITSEKFKGQSVYGTVYLETSERSWLSQLAAEIL
jgi:PhoH-like ATPase